MSTTTAVNEERAAYDAQIAGRTVCTLLQETAEKHGDLPAYTDLGGPTLTWADVRDRALKLAAGLTALGLQHGEVVALMLSNRSEHILADLAAVHAGGVPSTVYATLAPEQVQYVAADAAAAFAVLEGPDQLARWQPVLDQLPELRKVIVVNDCPDGDRYISWADFAALGESAYAADPAAVEERAKSIQDTDTLTLLYTSGTTGNPKGVPITHRMAMYEALCSRETAGLPEHPAIVSYLPFAHIADRVISYYMAMELAGHVNFCPDPAQLTAVLGQVRPNSFFGVPRVWEKIMAGITAFLSMETDEAKKAAIEGAMAVGRAYIAARENGGTASPELEAQFKAADEAVLSKIRALLGLDRVVHAMSAAAPLPLEVAKFFSGLGIAILDVWGMTETTGAVTANTNGLFKLGTVGRPFPGVGIRLGEDGEVLVQSTTCTPGYLNRAEATADLYVDGDWLATGDIGRIDEDGYLSIVDRKKELLITAGGENIAPSLIENHLKEHPLIGQSLAYGDRRPFVVALLTLDGEVAPVWAAARGIEDTSVAALSKHPLVLEEVGKAVEDANARLARVQQVKKWALLDGEWTAETEELTPTLKLKRRVIHTKYTEEIDALYT
ncbi:long-chain fatty acid--CoA ligase [Actinocorallia sp. API 0066]|uniref:AMP-dependent synthetase/ligase n=1 Tax=Actinocorallia sp. API 0066 TaxID=2896846 RepID=UPI001E43B9F0|nr:long-chain fatty acid--CoA ligase [Actinocorallia sp. API 0066]MCD0453385.1 long-chain fatty acid--CoA ligase [Actinocorallia sp. API 0066]